MKKILFALLAATMLIGCQEKKDDNVIRIGAAIALTGYGADFGESEYNAIQMLKELYKDANVKFYIEDTASDIRTGINAINKLININNVDIIYCELSPIVYATNNIIYENNKILIAPVYLESLTENPLAYRNLPSADQENICLIQYMRDHQIKHDKIVVLYSNDVFGQTCKDSFTRLINDEESLIEAIAINDNSLKDVCTKVIGINADVVYIGSMSENLGLLIRDLRQLGYNGEIITTDAYSYNYINEKAGELGKDVIYIDFANSSSYEQFKTDYKRRFNKDCVPSAMLCYDGISSIVAALTHDITLNEKYYHKGIIDTLIIQQQEIIYPIEAKRW